MAFNALLTIFATVLVGGLGMLAQWGRKNRGAEASLVVVLLALSLLAAGFGAFTGAGLLIEAARGSAQVPDQISIAAAGVAAVLAGLVGIGLCVPPLRKILAGRPTRSRWEDPPVFLAFWLFTMILANNLVGFLIFTQAPDVGNLFPTGRLSPATVVTTQLPFVVVALLGVGIGVRRNLRETLARLGFGRISLRQLGVVAFFIVGAYAVSVGFDRLFAVLQPELYRTVGELSSSLFNPAGLDPVRALLFGLLIGVGAGLGEETLFRGAVQPVLGIPLTSLLFASLHVQYGPSILVGYIFLLSVGLGLLRRHINTTASFLAHAGYNFIGVALAYFLGG